MKFSTAARTFRTVRHLRPSQVYWRLRYRCERSRKPKTPAEPADICLRGDWPEVPLFAKCSNFEETSQDNFIAEMEQGRFRHLNETRSLGVNPTDWLLGPVGKGRLWTITLHYHAWAYRLAAIAAGGDPEATKADECLRRLLADWIDNCRLESPGSRDMAWNAFAIATRIGWWCRIYHLLGSAGRKQWGELETKFLLSLWQQAAYLEKHLEWDLRANHLLRDVVGLAWAGRFFDDSAAKRWLAKAADLAREQAKEQLLPDGGHFERSPMYHVAVMEDFMTLAILLDDPAAKEMMRDTWRKMAEFLVWMRHPDGHIPLFNDAALNGCCPPGEMLAAGCRALDLEIDQKARRGGKLFEKFGMAVWHGDPWSLFFDVGPVGVDYQPGHAHADTLAIEASYQGERLFVDPGTFAYDNDESRRYDHATASHNTLTLDGTDSSEVWHIFRVGRRAKPIDVRFACENEAFSASAAHDGFVHISGQPRHTRQITVSAESCLTIVDRLTGTGIHRIDGGFLIAPGWNAEPTTDGWRLTNGRKCVLISLEDVSLKRFIEKRRYHFGYGRSEETARLCWQGVLQFPYEIHLTIAPLREGF